MKVLLIGPYPPPHGGISVHVSGIHRKLADSGVACKVLDTGRSRVGVKFGLTVLSYAVRRWVLHVHTNGHNHKSWLLALGCGLAGRIGSGSVLTLHSGMVPAYLATGVAGRRALAALTCKLYREVICVSPEIRSAVGSLTRNRRRLEVMPAFLGAESAAMPSEVGLHNWLERHHPLFSTVLFFRPEYGFDLLVAALKRVRRRHPSFGCLVMGSGEQRDDAEKLIREAHLEDRILLLGDVHHETCLQLMSRSDVFLRPTREDGDSISVREALAMGVPLVASRVGNRPPGAILFDPGNIDDLAAKIEFALTMPPQHQTEAEGCMSRLLEIYRHLEGAPC